MWKFSPCPSLGPELYLESSTAGDDFQAVLFLIISSPSKMDNKEKILLYISMMDVHDQNNFTI